MLKILICGSRTLGRPELAHVFRGRVDLPVRPLLLCGCAPGIDRAGYHLARKRGWKIEFHPAWEKQWKWALQVALEGEDIFPHIGHLGKAAGIARNRQMLDQKPDVVVAIWDGKSNGTKNMIAITRQTEARLIVEKFSSFSPART